mmetsp:Transcript_88904/g.206891  ORF Transcript_88904/g.206891 Transcript_88904/m.206891 type:complete len:196 (+) Transcript_88904:55-642(+)|eukprot:CAMPEP_0171096650 /NCGR_PEP_ID=MMETSP0766_2-20121228/45464_1 /TAXON_ID=439317 /ORGANISM="Gambierdiscus australes, Strain CAWD 149" /LENGTH=195 /DNA_ID=CAMNT_0011555673 /DNA_START=21 /DNA_END=608 /DNA_ORIENTATION=-
MVKRAVKRQLRPRQRVSSEAERQVRVAKDEVGRRRELAKQAIAAVQEALAQAGPAGLADKKGTFIPPDWKTKYKPVLGPYKRFILQYPKEFSIINHDPFNYTVVRAGQAWKSQRHMNSKAPGWQRQLLKAWMLYCKVTAKADRDPAAFTSALPPDAAKSEHEPCSAHGLGVMRKPSRQDVHADGAGTCLKSKTST